MSQTTFSGPIRSGTVREGAAQNTGVAVLAQTFTIPASAMLTAPAAVPAIWLPAGAKIMSITAEVTTAIATATNVGLQVGKVGGTANAFMTSVNTGVALAKVPAATTDAAQVVAATNNVGTTDVQLTTTTTAATGNASAGAITVTVTYQQRTADGSTGPNA